MRRKRKRNRLFGYDYSLPGWCFVTICTQNLVRCFGKVINSQMVLNDFGEIAKKQWYWLGRQYSYVGIDVFMVMPNHIHGILEIRDTLCSDSVRRNDTRRNSTRRDDTRSDMSKPVTTDDVVVGKKRLPLSNIVGAFEMTSSKSIHQFGYSDFSWQRSFHDRIIRNEDEYQRIRYYILQNPNNWCLDRNN